MTKRWLTERRRSFATLITGIVMGTVIVSPASAHVGSTWTHLWGTHIKPAVVTLFFTKSQLKNAGTINYWNNPVHWTKLKGVPSGLADGSDDGWELYAAGSVNAGGTPNWGDEIYGWTVSWDATNGRYVINIPGEDYDWRQYTTVVTPRCTGADSWRATDDGGTPGKLVVQFYSDAANTGSTMQCDFQFATY